MGSQLRILIVDASVLIDYALVAPEVLTLVSVSGAELVVPSPVFDDEVVDLDDDQAGELGLKLVDPSIEQMTEAGARDAAGGGLSFYDWLCYIMARDGGDWVVLTNDGLLRRTCEADDIATTRGLRLLLDLVGLDALPAQEAERIAREMCQINPTLGDKVLRQVLRALSDGE